MPLKLHHHSILSNTRQVPTFDRSYTLFNMKFINSAIALTLTIAGLSQASPIQSRAALKNFQLKTKVIPGHKDCGSDKNGLYIFSYHTGAGLGIAAGLNESMTSYFYINETTQGLSWTYPENEIGPWPVEIEYGPYQCKLPSQINYSNSSSVLTRQQPTFLFPSALLGTTRTLPTSR